MATFSFPQDLVGLQQALRTARAELVALYARLPHHAMPMDEPYTDGRGVTHPASPGWSPQDRARVDELWTRQRRLATAVVSHPYWDAIEPRSDVPAARSALKHVTDDGGPATER